MSALRITNPATGELIESVIADTPDSVHDKFRRAQKAQADWARSPLEERITAFEKFIGLVRANQTNLARTLTDEMGKPIYESMAEIEGVCRRIQYFIDAIPDELQTRVERTDTRIREEVRAEALGTIGVISAWNYPWFVGLNVLAPALLTGNSILYKPSELATHTGMRISELLLQSGVPADVMHLLIGAKEVGSLLCEQPLNGLFFTGSLKTGKAIAEKMALHNPFARTQYELGGKDPAYVCDDSPLTATVKSLVSGVFYNGGQSCCSVERIYVEKGIAAEFEDLFVASARALQIGHPCEQGVQLTPPARSEQIQFLQELVDDACQKGARTLCGGSVIKKEGLNEIYPPTVIVDVHDGMRIQQEEIFGPLVTIQEVEDDDEAVEQMNRCSFGLTAAVYSESRQRAETVLSQVQSGSAYWNSCERVSPCLPWSGRKNSGQGYTLGLEGIRAMLFKRSWHFIGLD